jgi:hypothetical protein
MSADVVTPIQSSRIRSKVKVAVEVILADGTTVSGAVFIGVDERVSDLLNDSKPFFPVRMENGEILLINKSSVALVKPLDVSRSV